MRVGNDCQLCAEISRLATITVTLKGMIQLSELTYNCKVQELQYTIYTYILLSFLDHNHYHNIKLSIKIAVRFYM